MAHWNGLCPKVVVVVVVFFELIKNIVSLKKKNKQTNSNSRECNKKLLLFVLIKLVCKR